jgi:hypothetical protein
MQDTVICQIKTIVRKEVRYYVKGGEGPSNTIVVILNI